MLSSASRGSSLLFCAAATAAILSAVCFPVVECHRSGVKVDIRSRTQSVVTTSVVGSTSAKSSSSSFSSSPSFLAPQATLSGFASKLSIITSLEDWDTDYSLPEMYSGYLAANAEGSKRLFTLFVPALGGSKATQTLVWFQGGPGCSSLLAAFAENGPIRFDTTTGKLQRNALTWAQEHNLVYITSPPCVGFSQADGGGAACGNSDNSTATYNLFALEQLIATVPSLATDTKLVLTGESYAGSYLFFLSDAILNRGSQAMRDWFSAIAVGNPVMSCGQWKVGANSTQVELFYWHGLIPLRIRDEWRSTCSGSAGATDPSCWDLMDRITAMIGPFDPDDLYTDTCTGNASLAIAASPPAPQCDSFQQMRLRYLNRASVQASLHAEPPQNPDGWAPCLNPPFLNYTSDWPSILPFYRQIFTRAPDVRILVYSGDTDIATCPHAYAQLCLGEMNLTVAEPWRPWLGANGQRLGFTEKYRENGLVFATVRGAGHEVPQFAPIAALTLINRFLSGEPI